MRPYESNKRFRGGSCSRNDDGPVAFRLTRRRLFLSHLKAKRDFNLRRAQAFRSQLVAQEAFAQDDAGAEIIGRKRPQKSKQQCCLTDRENEE